jgi:hypothetical protein
MRGDFDLLACRHLCHKCSHTRFLCFWSMDDVLFYLVKMGGTSVNHILCGGSCEV